MFFDFTINEERNTLVKPFSQFLLSFLVLGVIFSCARTPQHIELHSVYAIPRGTPLGPGIPLGVAEEFDSEQVRKSTVRVIYGEEPAKIVSSGFFVANDKIVTNIHVIAAADLTSLHVKSNDADFTIRGVTAFDVKNDLVILHVSGEGVPLVLGNSDRVKNGETVFSVGYPFDRFNVMKNTILPTYLKGTWFRMTPDIPPGSSGGPVLNAEGEVIGVNVRGSGLSGYAIESNVLKGLLRQSGPVEALARWQRRNPIRAHAYYVQASDKFFTADYTGAIEVLDKFIALNPMYVGMGMVYNNRGYAKTHYAYFGFDRGHTVVQQQHYRAAIKDFDKAISLNPEDISAYANRGYAKTLLGHSKFDSGHAEEALRQYYVALEDFDEVISVNSEFPAYAERGAVKVSLGISETNRGHTQKAQQSYYAAIDDFDKAISLNPEDTYVYIMRGYTKICLGDFEVDKGNMEDARSLYEATITDCDSAIELDAKNPYGYHTRGVAKAKLDDYTGAIEDFDKTINLKTNFAKAYYNRALVKVLLGQNREAKADFKKASELDPDLKK